MKKKTLSLLVGAALFLTTCVPKAPPSQEPVQPSAPVEAMPEPSGGEGAVWDAQGYTLETPASWDWLAVNAEGGDGQSEDTLFALYHAPTYSAGETSGWILSIVRWDQESYQTFIDNDITGMMIELATDNSGHIFGRVQPSDVQIADIDTYNEIVEVVNSEEMQAVLQDFIAHNGLDPVPEA